MPVTQRDVRHVASLARLGLDPARIEPLVRELNGILGHMEVLSAVDTSGVDTATDAGVRSASGDLPPQRRADQGPPIPLARPHEAFAPAMRDGFFLVPRLATHEDAGTEDGS